MERTTHPEDRAATQACPKRVSVESIERLAYREQNGGLVTDPATGQYHYHSVVDGSHYVADPLFELREALVDADKDPYFMIGAFIDALTLPRYSIDDARNHVRQVLLGQKIPLPTTLAGPTQGGEK